VPVTPLPGTVPGGVLRRVERDLEEARIPG
jgi:hypothetical protein